MCTIDDNNRPGSKLGIIEVMRIELFIKTTGMKYPSIEIRGEE